MFIWKLQSLLFAVRVKVAYINAVNNRSYKNAFPLTEFVCRSTCVAHGGSGMIMLSARYTCNSPGQVSGRDFSGGKVM